MAAEQPRGLRPLRGHHPARDGRRPVRREKGRPETPCYRCQSCSGLRRPVEFADAVVRGVITRYLAREDAGDLLPSPRAGPDRAALEAERTALRGRRAVQLRLHAEGSVDDDELKTALETFGARLAVISAELENTGRHSVLTGIAGRPDAAQVWDRLTLGLRREVIRACCEDPPVVFLPGKPPDVFNPELIKLNIEAGPGRCARRGCASGLSPPSQRAQERLSPVQIPCTTVHERGAGRSSRRGPPGPSAAPPPPRGPRNWRSR